MLKFEEDPICERLEFSLLFWWIIIEEKTPPDRRNAMRMLEIHLLLELL